MIEPDSSRLENALSAGLADLESLGRRRRLEGPRPGFADFVSNDVLGLSRDRAVIDAAVEALRRHGAGGRASRLLGGGSEAQESVESKVARWLDAEAALLFPSGFQANLAIASSIVEGPDVLFSDRLNHASIIDGCRLSRAAVEVFEHGDIGDLERRLARRRAARRRVVVTESLFSMDGDAAPVEALLAACERHDAALVIDEAHAIGLLGSAGAGLAACHARHPRLLARVVTGGKALGAAGAFVVGSRVLKDHLVNHARAFVYTTAPPPATVGALAAAIDRARDLERARERTLGLARSVAARLGAPPPAGAIVSFVLGDELVTLRAAEACRDAQLDVRAVRPPTVPAGTSRLRIVMHSFNTDEEVDRLVVTLAPHRASTAPSATRRRREPLVVVGTDTGVGKTVVAAILFGAARALGPARYWKPVQTGGESDTGEVRRLTGSTDGELELPEYSFPAPASPHEAAAAAGAAIDPARLDARLDQLRAFDGRVVIEPAGGLFVPYTDVLTLADWLAVRRPRCVVVGRSGLGTLNHTLLTVEALRARRLEPIALFLVGPPHRSNRETLTRITRIPLVYEVPPLERVERAEIDAWRSSNDVSALFAELDR